MTNDSGPPHSSIGLAESDATKDETKLDLSVPVPGSSHVQASSASKPGMKVRTSVRPESSTVSGSVTDPSQSTTDLAADDPSKVSNRLAQATPSTSQSTVRISSGSRPGMNVRNLVRPSKDIPTTRKSLSSNKSSASSPQTSSTQKTSSNQL